MGVEVTKDIRFVRAGSGYVAYQVHGAGPPLVLLSSPVTSCELLWDHPRVAAVLRRLASFSALVLFDPTGSGSSDPLHGEPQVEDVVAEIDAVLDDIGASSTHLFGSDLGCWAPLMYAATRPERTQSVVVMDGAARLARDDDYPIGMPPDLLRYVVMKSFEQHGTGANIAVLAPSLAEDEFGRVWCARLERLSSSPGTVRRATRLWSEVDVRSLLASIKAPALVIHHSDSVMMRVEHGRYLAERLPGARFLGVPGRDASWMALDGSAVLSEVERFVTGARPRSIDVDRVLVTLLFTDIVGSTDRAREIGDTKWRELLQFHDTVTARTVIAFGGRVVGRSGDGLLAVFDGPARGVRCAAALHEALVAEGLTIRAGVHTGEVERRGDNVGGIGVHIAARVAGHATGGETLVSRTVTDLVTGGDLTFTTRGHYTLKGLDGDWELFALSE